MSSVTDVRTVQLEATLGFMNIMSAIRRRGALRSLRPPLKGGHPPLHGYGGRCKQKQPLFYEKNFKRQSGDCESLRMMLGVLGRVPAPVVGVNDAFLRL